MSLHKSSKEAWVFMYVSIRGLSGGLLVASWGPLGGVLEQVPINTPRGAQEDPWEQAS